MDMPLLLILLISAAPGMAQNTLSLSLKRAVEIALTPEGSTRVALAQESIKQAEKRVSEAKSAFLPDLEASVQDRRQTTNLHAFGLNFPTIPGFSFPSVVGPFSVFDARATAQQSVFDFSNIGKYRASRTSLGATKSDFDATRNQVSDQVAKAYLACLRADAALETAKADVELSEALLKLAQEQRTAGTGTGIEVTRAQVQLANGRQRVIVVENDRRRTALQLLKTVGLKLDLEVEFTDKLSYQPVDVAGLEAALEKARNERAELKAQQQREETARLSYSSVRAERLPSLGAFADYGSIGSDIAGAQPTHTYGVSLKVPVFDGGRRDARREESLSQYRQEKVRTRDLQDQIDLEVRLALNSLRAAISEIETAREGLTLAESEVTQAQRRYQGGVASSIEVTDAQTRLDRARENQIAALYNYNLARLDLSTATGTIREYVNQ
jgi:outer membrane protein